MIKVFQNRSVNQEITPLQTLPLYNLGTDEISNYISFPPAT